MLKLSNSSGKKKHFAIDFSFSRLNLTVITPPLWGQYYGLNDDNLYVPVVLLCIIYLFFFIFSFSWTANLI